MMFIVGKEENWNGMESGIYKLLTFCITLLLQNDGNGRHLAKSAILCS